MHLIIVSKPARDAAISCLTHDLMIRGAITYGRYWEEKRDNNLLVVSDALVRAVKLEHSVGVPAVVIADDVLASSICPRIKPESQWRQLLREAGLKTNTEILVISGEEPKRVRRRAFGNTTSAFPRQKYRKSVQPVLVSVCIRANAAIDECQSSAQRQVLMVFGIARSG